VHAAVAYGTAELRPDPARPAGWTLLVDDVPQSYVDLADPEHLEFPYVRTLGNLVRRSRAERVLHLGGGGLTLPRLLHHRRPAAAQRVIERDPQLIELVRRFLPFPPSIDVEIGDAREAVEGAPAGGYDLIISDVFEGAAMPRAVGTGGFAAAARRALTPDGLLAVNLTDVPPLAHTRVQAATFRSAFGDAALLGDPAIFRGRRAGNIVLLAGNVPMVRSDKHEQVVGGTDLAEFIGGAKARLDEPA